MSHRILLPIAASLAVAASAAAADFPTPRSQGLLAGSDPGRTAVAIPRALRRPFHLPRVKPGQRCPVAKRRVVSPAYGPALGPGPAYPASFDESSTLHYAGAAFPRPWTGNKVLWIVGPQYRGPILVRGRQLDAAFWVGFDRGVGVRPYVELHLEGDGSTWHDYPSYTRVRKAGCFAYQIDGTTFSRVIVFRTAP
jgi:hypothetical protein